MRQVLIGVVLGIAVLTATLFSVTRPATAVILDATTKSLELVTTTTAGIDYSISYADHTSSAFTPGNTVGKITTATTTTILSAPGASTQRQIKNATIRNISATTSNTVTLQMDVSATNYELFKRVLGPGESLEFDANESVSVYDSTGRAITALSESSGVNGNTYQLYKAGSAKDAAGYHYWLGKDAGFPGGFALQAPGVNGYTTDCSIASQITDPNGAAQMGAHPLPDPASGSLYLTTATFSDGIIGQIHLIDVLWYNTGLTVTTTTAQNITMPTLPNRDLNGTNNGAGWGAALYALTALGNAAVVSNTTISYTDQDGNASNTGTFSGIIGWQAPATPVIGTWMPFQLAAGDSGIRSIQSITLGTTYTSGTMSLVLYRVLATIPIPVANAAYTVNFPAPGIKIHPNSCISALQIGVSATTASNVFGSYTIIER